MRRPLWIRSRRLVSSGRGAREGNDMVVSGRRGALCLALACVAGLMAGCATNGGGYQTRGVAYAPAPDGTNAPVQGGVNVTPGSEEDFMVNVGRRTFFSP